MNISRIRRRRRVFTIDNHRVLKTNSGVAPSCGGCASSKAGIDWYVEPPGHVGKIERVHNTGGAARDVGAAKDGHYVGS